MSSLTPTFSIREEFDVMVVGGEDDWVRPDAVIINTNSNNNKTHDSTSNDTAGSPLIPLSESPSQRFRILDYVIFMVAAVQVSRILQVDFKFHNPAFIIWFSTSWLILCFPCQALYHKVYARRKGSIVEILGGIDILKRNFKLAPLFTIFWYLANYLFAWGIPWTNVASSLAIEQLATVFVFILSVLFLREDATIGKILSVIVCIGGVFIVAFSDNRDMHGGKDPLRGDLLIIGSCCATAVYMVTYKKVVGNTDVAAVNTLLGFIGLYNLIFLWPFFTILHYMESEPILPLTGATWGLLLTNSILSFSFNYLLNLGIFFTSPLFFRVGQICSIPASFILSILIGDPFVWLKLVGAFVVVFGFSLFSYFSHKGANNKVQ